MSPLLLAVVCVAVLCALFGAGRAYARRINNYGIVDILWSYAFALVAIACATCEGGWIGRRMLIAAMAVIWSLRLGTHVLVRVTKHHPAEDARYAQLRREWGDKFPSKMTGFFQLQAASVVVLCLPFFLSCRNPAAGFSLLEIAGPAVWLIGICGEALADAQLAAFKNNPANRGLICQTGLWRFSRHPNYFFEWTIWMGYFLFACGSPWGWISLTSPACILYFLLGVTGIPMTEQQSLRSKGDAYRRYQRTTSAFVPWFPQKEELKKP